MDTLQIIMLAILFIALTAFGASNSNQESKSVKQTYSDGSYSEIEMKQPEPGTLIRSGKATWFFADGQTAFSGKFSKGRKVGQWAGWHPNGEKAWVGKYKGGERTKTWLFYDVAGKPIPGLTGDWVLSDQVNQSGSTRAVGYLVDGVPQGSWRMDWYDGTLLALGKRVDGKREGSWVVHHLDGSPAPLLGAGIYQNGKWVGELGPEDWTLTQSEHWDLPAPDSRNAPEGTSCEGASRMQGFLSNKIPDPSDLASLSEVEAALMLKEICALLGAQSLGWSFDRKPEGVAKRNEVLLSAMTLSILHGGDQVFWAWDLAYSDRDTNLQNRSPFFQNFPLFPLERPRDVLPSNAIYSAREKPLAKKGKKKSPDRASVALALEWLASSQTAEGLWDTLESDPVPTQGIHMGLTALATLSFLGADSDPLQGEYASSILKGLDALIAGQEDSGLIRSYYNLLLGKPKFNSTFMYEHSLATLALAEAYHLSGHPRLRAPLIKATSYLCSARAPYGGWRYKVPSDGDGDTSVSAWAYQAVFASRAAGIEVDADARERLRDWLVGLTDSSGVVGYTALDRRRRSSRMGINADFESTYAPMTAAGLALFLLFDWEKDFELSPLTTMQAKYLAASPLSWGVREQDSYYAYFGTLAEGLLSSRNKRKHPLTSWRKDAAKGIIRQQVRTELDRGSWEPTDVWGIYGGRVFTTTMYTLALENKWRTCAP